MRTELRQGTLHLNGLTIESRIGIELDPHTEYVVGLEFQVREGTVQTAMRLKSYNAEFGTDDGEKLDSIRLTDGVSNTFSIRVCTGKKPGLLSVFNEYLHSYHEHAAPVYEYMTGDAGIIVEEEGGMIRFRCNNRDPREQFAFEDVTGVLTVSKVVPEVYNPS
ncbi:hypothetical protein [Corynebacterium cystitidis]|uniref:Uncharacterized protein n=1 Tax=Corynebacterium cystitidis DSM 20524 TaxID=1121357 RepID=A0A1H9UCC9_9CORY|nr:hypothetical protein [Corynebacterium cystitidis]WJY81281.1 hypothetical protein CCYS_01525 [Corynebacterium cystitidis DSM 20524]SES06804.1 hypothetical protein SAMN05661109_01776 [Corynebacterium cystitidis DSM 20524]SNV88702.1 Uncharacterised protein [Corynebacterium cystitidis]